MDGIGNGEKGAGGRGLPARHCWRRHRLRSKRAKMSRLPVVRGLGFRVLNKEGSSIRMHDRPISLVEVANGGMGGPHGKTHTVENTHRAQTNMQSNTQSNTKSNTQSNAVAPNRRRTGERQMQPQRRPLLRWQAEAARGRSCCMARLSVFVRVYPSLQVCEREKK